MVLRTDRGSSACACRPLQAARPIGRGLESRERTAALHKRQIVFAGAADDEFMPNNTVQLYAAWRKDGAAAERHIYVRGRNGFDFKPNGTTRNY